MLQIAQSTYYERRAITRDPDRASARAKSDSALSTKIDTAWQDNRKLYGARKIWRVLRRDGEEVARCTVERLMRAAGKKGVVRGKKVITTQPDTSQPCPDDKVNQLFMADRPNKLCPLGVCCAKACRVTGFRFHLCADMVWHHLRGPSPLDLNQWPFNGSIIDVFARRIVALRVLHAKPFRVTAWRASTSMKTQCVLPSRQICFANRLPGNGRIGASNLANKNA